MTSPFKIAARIALQVHHKLWSAWQGGGQPHSREIWDEQHGAGQWDYLNCLDEFDRYSIIAGYIWYFFDRADVLDLGCGHGRLLRLLHPSRSEEHTSELQSHSFISYAVFSLKKK